MQEYAEKAFAVARAYYNKAITLIKDTCARIDREVGKIKNLLEDALCRISAFNLNNARLIDNQIHIHRPPHK